MTKQLVYRGASVEAYYEPDRRSIARCAIGPELTQTVLGIVEGIAKPYAIGISPRRTGHYAHSFETNLTAVALGDFELMTRVVAELANTDEAAGAIEFGHGRRNPGHHVLGRTLAMLHHGRGVSDVAAEAGHMAATFENKAQQRIAGARARLDEKVRDWESARERKAGERR